jgi:hypothetical protein
LVCWNDQHRSFVTISDWSGIEDTLLNSFEREREREKLSVEEPHLHGMDGVKEEKDEQGHSQRRRQSQNQSQREYGKSITKSMVI